MHTFTTKVLKTGLSEAKLICSDGGEYPIGPAPQFGGKEGILNPEEMLVGSVNACLMLTLFYFLKKNNIEIESYESQAVGTLEKGPSGFRFTKIEVSAKINLKDPTQKEKVQELTTLAKKYCLISNSLTTDVEYVLEAG